ncbi:hypothetical protein QQ045_011153 [Rhodiola kirilowii]
MNIIVRNYLKDCHYEVGKHSLADSYEYVTQGKLYKVSEEGAYPNIKAEIYISFGGLLYLMKGDPTTFNQFQLGQRLFLLMKKVPTQS